jgi:hypothetical protein
LTDLATRAAQIAQEARESAPARRARNRKEMPASAAFVDEWRGMGGRFLLRENGRVVEFGKGAPDAKPVTYASIREWVAARYAAMEKGKKRAR